MASENATPRAALPRDGSLPRGERALLLAVARPERSEGDRPDGGCAQSMSELRQLAATVGAQMVAEAVQTLARPNSRTYVGKGKVDELSMTIDALEIDVAIANDPLTPLQQRNLEQGLGIPVVDRTELIMDIFARRARSREGKIQVELAQLEYRLPRLVGRGKVLSRLGGGIGTRGPGETVLEADRRRLRHRIRTLHREIEAIRQHRREERRSRERSALFTAALVGYTNVGKSTLLNGLTGSDLYADDQVFATLDPATRLLRLPHGEPVFLTDTVGFIDRLPHTLVAAFSATLEETVEADLLLHIVDASAPDVNGRITAVYDVLEELGALDYPMITVVNKIDIAPPEALDLLPSGESVVRVSAKTGEGLDDLRAAIEAQASQHLKERTLLLPFHRMDIVNELHRRGSVLAEEYRGDGVMVRVRIPRDLADRLQSFVAR